MGSERSDAAAPDDGEPWYALDILAQCAVHPEVVTTVRERELVYVVYGAESSRT